VLLADKKLTLAQPFDFETEKRSLTRYASKPAKVRDEADKENYAQIAPVKRQGV